MMQQRWFTLTVTVILFSIDANCSDLKFPEPDEFCTSHFKTKGICMIIQECNEIITDFELTSQKKLFQDLLRKSQCGFDGFRPKICCPISSSSTPSSTLPVTNTKTPMYQNVDADHKSEQRIKIKDTFPPDVSNHPNINLLPKSCGEILEGDKITNGEKTSIYEYPWMALIGYKSKDQQLFGCGGSIISSRFILTAAHCVTNLNNLILTGVRVGEHDIETEEDCEGPAYDKQCTTAQDFSIESILFHPEYNRFQIHNDIALIKLKTPIDFSKDNVFPICLPISEELRNIKLEGLNLKVAGWGITENKIESNVLLQVQIPVIFHHQCIEIHASKLFSLPINNHKQICAGGEGGRDACKGDSGGPLMMANNVSNIIKFVQHGIVSYGPVNCGSEIPGVYTRIVYYMDWILDQLQK